VRAIHSQKWLQSALARAGTASALGSVRSDAMVSNEAHDDVGSTNDYIATTNTKEKHIMKNLNECAIESLSDEDLSLVSGGCGGHKPYPYYPSSAAQSGGNAAVQLGSISVNGSIIDDSVVFILQNVQLDDSSVNVAISN
jgi:hypothetical protein